MRRTRLIRPFVLILVLPLLGPFPLEAASENGGRRSWCGTYPEAARDAVWAHREAISRPGRADLRSASASATASLDVGNVAVLKNEGDMVFLKNPLDLQGKGFEFSPVAAGYSLSRVDRPVVPDTGTRLSLTDDSNVAVPLPFAFTFYGKSYSQVFVNSDGNVTFGVGESSSTARTLGRLVAGPPRIAPLLTDLDPGVGGTVTTSGDGDRFRVTWSEVPLFEQRDKNTFQVTLNRDGRIEFAYDATNLTGGLDEGVAGIGPGAEEGGVTVVDLSAAAGATGAGAIAESFRSETSIDTVAVARKFYRSHPDDFQQLIVYTSRPSIGRSQEAFAFEQTVSNRDTGIGVAATNETATYGSAGRLESFVLMDFALKYPADLNQKMLGDDSALSVLAHEVGHRWLAQARFRDGAADSEELLGRQKAHWSYAMNSSGSHDEGNDIEDLGGGQFRTGVSSVRYGPLDQYLMGIRPPEEVPPFFFIRTPKFVTSGAVVSPEESPGTGVGMTGTRKDVTVNDVIAAMGPRNPPAAAGAPPFRVAFIYVTLDESLDAPALERIESIRAAFEPFFAQSTGGRRTIDTRLN